MTVAWPQVALGDVADINPKPSARLQPDTKVAFVPMAAVDAVRGTVQPEVRRVHELSTGLTPFESGDVLVAKITPCFENGKIAQALTHTAVAFGSTEFHVVRSRPDYANQRYILHFLRQSWVRVAGQRRMIGSAGQRRVPEAYLRELKVPIPPVEEQRRIATVLDAADELRGKRRESLALLDSLAESIFLEMFGDPVANVMGWRRAPLGELLDRIDSGKSPVCLDRRVRDGEWGVLKLGAVTWGEFDENENKALPPSVVADPALEVHPGDLLFTRKNTRELVGAVAYIHDTRPKLLLSDLIFRLQTHPDSSVDVQYLHRLLAIPSKRREVQRLAGGSAGSMPNISKARLAGLPVELPPLDQQLEFVRRSQAARHSVLQGRLSANELDALFASLQQRAFRGVL